jgi:hypothetical protein
LPEHERTNFRIGEATAVRDAAIARQGFDSAINLYATDNCYCSRSFLLMLDLP